MSLILFASTSSPSQLLPPALFTACQTTAAATPSALRGAGKNTKMWCAVVDREGQLMLIKATGTGGKPTAPAGSDAWRGSIEIAIAKAFTARSAQAQSQRCAWRGSPFRRIFASRWKASAIAEETSLIRVALRKSSWVMSQTGRSVGASSGHTRVTPG